MESTTADAPRPWYASRRFQRGALLVFALFAAGEGIVSVFLKDNDFLWHRGIGQGFLEGDPYKYGGGHYLPSRPMLNSLTAWMPYRLDRAVVYLAAIAALAWTLRAWQRLADRSGPLSASSAFAAAVCALAITVTYFQRDLDECGLQILLLFFLTAAAVQLQADRPLRCGFWLALAAAYKLTPLLFLPYLCYKRQWRATAWTVVFFTGFCLAPALWLGWGVNVAGHERWWANTRASLALTDPSENGVEAPNVRNQSLQFALARYVQSHPPGHPLTLAHPLFVQFGALEPAQAKRVVQALLLGLAGALAWRFRKRFVVDGDNLPREWAAVAILAAILSPLCWLQHLVLVLPAVYLVVRAAFEPGARAPWRLRLGAPVAVVMILAGQRDVLGHGFFLLVMSYKVHTWAALAAIFLVLTLPESSRRRCANRVSAARLEPEEAAATQAA
jgi:hypothetical protein